MSLRPTTPPARGMALAIVATLVPALSSTPAPNGGDGRAPPGAAHWSFQPPALEPGAAAPPALPPEGEAWARNDVDRFVFARLAGAGLEPSPEADRPALLRRLHLDLTGLPPSPEELEAFLRDDRPGAYGRQVEGLLASPHYGERWARPWLDLARYADSDGYEKDRPRPDAWRWRDWVIDAVARDLPLDRFAIEQLAGDLLPGAAPDQRLATGFHRNTLTNEEGGVDREEFRVAAVVDRVNTTATAFLGLTLACAQCHDHKYDPFSQREYYGLFAFFNGDDEVDVPVEPTAAERAGYREALWRHQERELELERALAPYRPGLAAALEELERVVSGADSAPAWEPLEVLSAVAENGSSLELRPDRSILAGGASPGKEDYTVVARAGAAVVTGLRIEVFPAGEQALVGRTSHGNLVLSELELERGVVGDPDDFVRVPLRGAWADHSQDGWPVVAAIDGELSTGWALKPHYAAPHRAVFRLAEPLPLEEDSLLRLRLRQHYGSRHTIAHFRLSVTAADPRLVTLAPELHEALAAGADGRTAEQAAALAEHLLAQHPEAGPLHAELAEHRGRAPAAPAPRAAVLRRRPEPRPSHVLVRGNFQVKGEAVEPHVPAVLGTLTPRGARPDRLDLARWIADPANPLTARVAANRIWARLFGRGLVSTPDDFGTRGAAPTHPQLLDYLAAELVRRGWSRKELLRLILESATYRQSSRFRPVLIERDPDNELLARQGRFRVEAETVRDLGLAAAGLVDRRVGGPSVRPPLPADVARLGYANQISWPVSSGSDRYRRGLYVFAQRTVPYPMLATFDAADASVCTVRRERSNTPLQALTLLGDPVFVECARGLAGRVLGDLPPGSADDPARLDRAFAICLTRFPEPSERESMAAFLAGERARFAADPDAARALAGDALPAGTDPAESAAWVALARVLLNLDELVTRE